MLQFAAWYAALYDTPPDLPRLTEHDIIAWRQHMITQCQLKATTRGISYETSDKDDAFTASLETVEAFEVDYLKNNLSLKVRGKTYNFSDPDGNANKLFAFHRDVEHARSRIAKGDIPVD